MISVDLLNQVEASLERAELEIRRLVEDVERLTQERDEARAEVERITRERDEARANYQWMVERAAAAKLDGYRELGQRAAEAENSRDEVRRELDEAQQAIAKMHRLRCRGEHGDATTNAACLLSSLVEVPEP